MGTPDLDALARQLDASRDYLVLRRFEPPRAYTTPGGQEKLRTALSLDLETTGLDARHDAIIQFSAVPFTYDAETGRVFEVQPTIDYLEDPGRPIPPDITALTGITDQMVKGKRIDDAAVDALLQPVSLVIAHNAEFDRPFTERRLPVFKDKAWACSIRDVPWRQRGLSSASLEFLLMKRCHRFYGAHRADQDAAAVVHLLATPFDDGVLPMTLLLESARAGQVRIWAEGSPIATKDVLKARRYRWNPGTDGRPKAWYRDLDAGQKDAELAWLTEHVFAGTLPRLRIDTLDARVRFSNRADGQATD
jgi:DNA polymerase-3 subunit epsilon